MCSVIFKRWIGVLLFCCVGGRGLCLHAHTIKKIKTPHFSLLFDAGMTHTAQRIANTLETIYWPISKTLGGSPSPIRVWFDTASTYSNGYFAIGPRHIRLYTHYTANPYFVGNLDWISFLSLHEFRHAVQYNVQYHSIPWLLKPVYSLMNMVPFVGVPRFFSEGDAIGIETAFSKSGRGRLPGWDVWYKLHLLEDSNPVSLDQFLFDSVRHRLPDYYCLGYYLTTHIRRHYGPEAIQKVYKKSIRVPFFGFYSAIRSATNRSLFKIYREMTEELRLGWQKQVKGLPITPVTQLTVKKPTDDFDYINPFMDASGNLLAWKSGRDIRNQLVLLRPSVATGANVPPHSLPTLREQSLCYCLASELLAAAFAVGAGCTAWLEPWKHALTLADLTGEPSDTPCRMRLQYYDCKTKKIKTIVKNCSYNALAISPDKRWLVAVEPSSNGQHHLVILNRENGKVIKKISHPDGRYYLTPSWSGNTHIVVASTKDQQNAIIQVEVATGTTETLLPNAYEHRNSPIIYKDYLLYNSSYNGIDNIYALHLPTKACFQVTSRKYGAYLGMVDPVRNQLIFSDCAKGGMDIVSMPFDPLSWLPLEKVEDRSVHYYAPLVIQENGADLLSKVPHSHYPVQPYRFGSDSLSLDGGKRERNKVIPFELKSLQEHFKLSPYFYYNICTLAWIGNKFSLIGIEDNGKLEGKVGINVIYKTSWPLLSLDMGWLWYKQSLEKKVDGKRLELAIGFPFYFSLATSKASLILRAAAILRPLREAVRKGEAIKYPIDLSPWYRFDLGHASTRSAKDIHAPWEQELFVRYKHRITAPTIHANVKELKIRSNAYFPGIGMHHYCGVNMQWVWVLTWKEELIKVIQKEDFSYEPVFRTEKLRLREPLLIGVNYGFPLCYPECGLPLLLFIKRVRCEAYLLNLDVKESVSKLQEKGPWGISKVGIKFRVDYGLLSIKDRPQIPHIEFNFFIKGDKWFWDKARKPGFSIETVLF
ncbi:TolB family protein [Candidatus Cardinium hertigii]|uniref:Uncharacterized protein n=1 Tax=Candidatus Cardinium hertigii TaxID=247481 RepID=A0A2Z3L8V7_9BACT|nr:hypothetical protein [Candidatus Cardinium hertigii]AWN82003.1 hypothetical protein DK880_00692 [Candidatus Cardinium hertigii]